MWRTRKLLSDFHEHLISVLIVIILCNQLFTGQIFLLPFMLFWYRSLMKVISLTLPVLLMVLISRRSQTASRTHRYCLFSLLLNLDNACAAVMSPFRRLTTNYLDRAVIAPLTGARLCCSFQHPTLLCSACSLPLPVLLDAKVLCWHFHGAYEQLPVQSLNKQFYIFFTLWEYKAFIKL